MTRQDIIPHAGNSFIGGQWSAPSSDATITVRNSATEEIFEVMVEAQEADVDRAVEAARRAFDTGPRPRMAHEEGAAHMHRLADELDRRADR